MTPRPEALAAVRPVVDARPDELIAILLRRPHRCPYGRHPRRVRRSRCPGDPGRLPLGAARRMGRSRRGPDRPAGRRCGSVGPRPHRRLGPCRLRRPALGVRNRCRTRAVPAAATDVRVAVTRGRARRGAGAAPIRRPRSRRPSATSSNACCRCATSTRCCSPSPITRCGCSTRTSAESCCARVTRSGCAPASGTGSPTPPGCGCGAARASPDSCSSPARRPRSTTTSATGPISRDFMSLAELEETRSALAVPLQLQGEFVGVLEVWRRRASLFTERDVRRMVTLADFATIAIDNARLHDDAGMPPSRRGQAGPGRARAAGGDAWLGPPVCSRRCSPPFSTAAGCRRSRGPWARELDCQVGIYGRQGELVASHGGRRLVADVPLGPADPGPDGSGPAPVDVGRGDLAAWVQPVFADGDHVGLRLPASAATQSAAMMDVSPDRSRWPARWPCCSQRAASRARAEAMDQVLWDLLQGPVGHRIAARSRAQQLNIVARRTAARAVRPGREHRGAGGRATVGTRRTPTGCAVTCCAPCAATDGGAVAGRPARGRRRRDRGRRRSHGGQGPGQRV